MTAPDRSATDVASRLPAPRQITIEVTWEPWPGYGGPGSAGVDRAIERTVHRHLQRLVPDLGRVAADVHLAEARSADQLANTRQPISRTTYAEVCERDAAASAAAWGDLPPDHDTEGQPLIHATEDDDT